MANVNSSMSKRLDMAEAVRPEANKASKDSTAKAKNGASFESHLEAPAVKRALADKKAAPTREAKVAQKPEPQAQAQRSSIDMNTKKPAPQKAQPTDTAQLRSPSREHKAEASRAARPSDKLEQKPVKSQLTGMTESTKRSAEGKAKAGAVLVLQPGDIPAEGQDQLDEIAYDPSTTEGEPWQDRLQDMLSFMGVPPQTLQQHIPSLAILTGQLQQIEPEAIPETLADSKLLQNVMASADPEALMEQVKPLGLWLDEMGWSPEGLVIKDPEAFQEMMNTPVSLKDVMTTLEVDVNRVVTEANLLKDTLPLEGAAPYMQRAARMQAELGSDKKSVKGATASDEKVDLLAMLNANAAASLPQDAAAAATLAKEGASKSAEVPKNAVIDQLMAKIAPEVSAESLPTVALTNENPFQAMDMHASETFTFQNEGMEIVSNSKRQDWLENIQAFQLQSDGAEATPSMTDKAGFSPEALLERMAEVSVAALGESSSDQKDQGEDFLSEGESSTPEMTHTAGTQKSQNSFELGNTETQKAEPTNPVQKAVFEKAEMLVKEGGGAIRIDIGNQETGAIDLAVEVKDNTVEVKITAETPEARQMLAQELPKLRESLQNQNLNLSRVEVGLSGGSSWTSSDGRSSGRESSSSQQSEELLGVNGRGGRKTSKSYSRVSSSEVMQPQVTREGGGIKVRV